MPSSINVQLAHHQFKLLADRGMYWPDQQTLFVSDTHFGKAATFRRHGIPVPVGSTEGTLAMIAGMLTQTQASRLTILGDMFHARSSLSHDVTRSLESFMDRFADVGITLVRGNHDARVGDLPSSWPIEIVEPGITIEGVSLGHVPGPVPPGADLFLCGHIHPAVRLVINRESFGKHSCFWHSAGCMVLPAIGQFTGTHVVELAKGDQAWIVSEGEIHETPVL
ncbi:ligase-associated DNA damage response endonuclease PdeM [Rubripirellula amarantea]|nr:ligase-associated DNA damage response endonuclease PdeM [Rubripirellula amarantea]